MSNDFKLFLYSISIYAASLLIGFLLRLPMSIPQIQFLGGFIFYFGYFVLIPAYLFGILLLLIPYYVSLKVVLKSKNKELIFTALTINTIMLLVYLFYVYMHNFLPYSSPELI